MSTGRGGDGLLLILEDLDPAADPAGMYHLRSAAPLESLPLGRGIKQEVTVEELDPKELLAIKEFPSGRSIATSPGRGVDLERPLYVDEDMRSRAWRSSSGSEIVGSSDKYWTSSIGTGVSMNPFDRQKEEILLANFRDLLANCKCGEKKHQPEGEQRHPTRHHGQSAHTSEKEEEISPERKKPEKCLPKEILEWQADTEAKWLQISGKAFVEDYRTGFNSEAGFLNTTFGRTKGNTDALIVGCSRRKN